VVLLGLLLLADAVLSEAPVRRGGSGAEQNQLMMRNVVSLIVQTGTGAFCDGAGFFGGCFATFADAGE